MSKPAIPKHVALEEFMTEKEKALRDTKISQMYLGGSIQGRLNIARYYCKLKNI